MPPWDQKWSTNKPRIRRRHGVAEERFRHQGRIQDAEMDHGRKFSARIDDVDLYQDGKYNLNAIQIRFRNLAE